MNFILASIGVFLVTILVLVVILIVNGIPVRRIFRITWIGTLAVLLLTFFLGGSAPMLINGENYADWLWLKLSDMFVITSLLMLVAGIGAVCFGATRYIRKKN